MSLPIYAGLAVAVDCILFISVECNAGANILALVDSIPLPRRPPLPASTSCLIPACPYTSEQHRGRSGCDSNDATVFQLTGVDSSTLLNDGLTPSDPSVHRLPLLFATCLLRRPERSLSLRRATSSPTLSGRLQNSRILPHFHPTSSRKTSHLLIPLAVISPVSSNSPLRFLSLISRRGPASSEWRWRRSR